MLDNALNYWSEHILLANASHTAGGFGLAVILQCYLRGQAFVPAWVGWGLFAFSLVAHLWAFTH